MKMKTLNKLRHYDAKKNWHGVFRFKKELLSLTSQTERTANMLLSLLAKHWRYCDKNCCYRKVFDFNEINKLYTILVAKYPQNVRLQVDWAYFQHSKNVKKYITAIKKIIIRTGKKEFYTMIGHIYTAKRNHLLARKYLLLAAPFIRNHYGIYYALAKNAQNLKDKTAKKKYAKKALRIFKSMPRKYHRDPVTIVFINELKTIMKNRD